MQKNLKKKVSYIKKRIGYKKFLLILLLLVFLVSAFLCFELHHKDSKATAYNNNLPHDFSEVSMISAKSDWDFNSLLVYFSNLANKKSAVYAFEVLKRVQLPPNIDLHLLGHAIGDILYKQEGIEGIKYCTQDFRNACSHSVVIAMFFERGDQAISQILDVCRRAPGGPGAYAMCFHGLGHGVLAYAGYDFPKMVSLCKKIQPKDPYGVESSECVGGGVMEIISGGGHDHEIWRRQRAKYLNPTDPLSLCRTSFIPSQAHSICYSYITPYLFEAAGGDLSMLNDQNFKDAFIYCSKMPAKTLEEISDRSNCYGGFGKEFVVLAHASDIRNIGNMPEPELRTVYDWCLLANDSKGTSSCLYMALQSLFWGGENNPDASYRFCAILKKSYKEDCYQKLTILIQEYIKDSSKRASLCEKLPLTYKTKCYQ